VRPPDTQPHASAGGESHGNDTETTRPAVSDETIEPLFGGERRGFPRNSLNVAAGNDETVNPCGCKPESGIWIVWYPPRYGAQL